MVASKIIGRNCKGSAVNENVTTCSNRSSIAGGGGTVPGGVKTRGGTGSTIANRPAVRINVIGDEAGVIFLQHRSAMQMEVRGNQVLRPYEA
jgi:hypothetical protein